MFFSLFIILGLAVTRWPVIRLDGIADALRGRGVRYAWIFTLSGYGSTLTGILTVLALGALLAHAFLRDVIYLAVSQTLSQGAVYALKSRFTRARPGAWLKRKESGYSYPSGHACTAVVFYGTAAVLFSTSSLPPPLRSTLGMIVGLWGFGIVWSRLVLSAHFFTDVLGGLLLGVSWVFAGIALARHIGLPIR